MVFRLILPRSAQRTNRLRSMLQHVPRPVSTASVVCKSAAGDVRPAAQVEEEPVVPQIIKGNDLKFQEGKEYYGFECRRIEHIPDFGIVSYMFNHLGTGTALWHLDRKETNNVFSINFRTTPFDSTGLPHILEHSVLCGSKNYPVRDPFFKMLNRSVATFMNAMTGPDYTMYPFSTMNEIDYRNLQKIYLDAALRPNLAYLDFLQEGWRLEHANLRDDKSEYVIKGVVYNEMKGAFSENSSIFGQSLLNNLLPDHTYGYVSGGNPLEIPKLTHADLVDFHKKYYHPSNAKIYSYGNFDLNKTLKYVHEEYLSKFSYVDNSYSKIPNQPRWNKPRNVHVSSRFDNMGAPFEKQNQIAIALVLADITNVQDVFELHILTELLVRGPNSPFYKNLVEPNFSGGYNNGTGYECQVKDTYFGVGLQDLRVDDFEKVTDLFDSTLEEVMETGFRPDHVESVLHNIELSVKHQSPSFGVSLLFNITPLWQHEGNVLEAMHISKQISNLRNKLKQDPEYLQKKVEHYFADNPHKLTLTMTPDEHYEDNFKQAELELIRQKTLSLDANQRAEIYENGLKLEEAQKAVPNIELLPCLSVEDVREGVKLLPINVMKINQVPTQVVNVQTNDISYMKCYFDANALSREEVLLIPLFCNVIDEVGTENYDYREFDQVVTSKTAGIAFKLYFSENTYDSKTYDVGMYVTTHALDKNVEDMFSLCAELLTTFKIDDIERLQMLIDNYMSNIAVGITSSGHLYAMQSCAGLISNSGRLRAELAGMEHIDMMKNYLKTNSTEQVRKNLISLGKKLFNKGSMRVAFNTSDEFYPKLMEHYEQFLNKLPAVPVDKVENMVNFLEPSCQHYVMNIPVNYCAQAFYTVPYLHRDHPVLRILAKFISSKYLLPVVREQNGAYGAGAKLGADGIFCFYSYRDPNSIQTLQSFDNTYQWLQEHESELTEQALFEAKLGVLQQLDAPTAPGNMGVDFFLYGITNEMFQKYRARMLSVTLPELKTVVDKYFKEPPPNYGKCLLGPEIKDLEEHTKLKWKVIA